MRLVDTHCHLDFDRFDHDREAVVERALEAGLVRMISIGISFETSENAIALAEQYEAVYASAGLHPNAIAEIDFSLEEAIARLRDLAAHPKVVAIGECGLDYYWDKAPADVQAAWFGAQLDLAAEMRLPVIIHNRDSTADMLAQLAAWREEHPHERPGVLHSFFGTVEEAQHALDRGFYLGITGPVTFRKADETRAVAAMVPTDRLLVETDSPFLTPSPMRGRRNEPGYVRYVAEKIAEVRGLPAEELADATTQNADRLFKLGLEAV